LQKQYLKNGREVSRGVKQRELYVCENTNMPSVLTEVGFITHSGDRNYITSKAGQNELAQAIYEALSEWKQLTKGGKVPQRTLRNLRYTHHDPITMVTTPQRETTEADARAKEAAEAKVVAEAQAEEKAKAQAQAQKQAQQGATAEPATPVVTEPATPTAAEGKIYFAIQLMNTAKKLEAGDYRLKGFKDVRFIPAGERFKGIYSYSESYLDIKNELVQVRETFPEAFIVAFRGDQQITTAEALANLKL
jgi:N-acetylmuramoyl-L-alanine amidase